MRKVGYSAVVLSLVLCTLAQGCWADAGATAAAKPRVVLVGGFLGCGKTTLLYQTAKALIQKEKRVGLVTNDQAPQLVDTKYLRDAELGVREVAGGCFCCKFDDFADALTSFVKTSAPDVILAEPVGSCTDISATVLQPLKDKYSDRLQLAPYSVLIDPERAGIALTGYTGDSQFEPGAQYIIRKQVEEADVIVLNKIDVIKRDDAEKMVESLRKTFPRAEVFAMSAKTGKGVGEWLEYVLGSNLAGRNITDVDYDTYAAGEATLGWLNCTARLTEGTAGDARALCADLMRRLQSALLKEHGEIAHVKMILEDPNRHSIRANLTSNAGRVSTDGSTWSTSAPLELTLNARVQIAPNKLESIVRKALSHVAGGRMSIETLQSFRPARPKPTHRYQKVVGLD